MTITTELHHRPYIAITSNPTDVPVVPWAVNLQGKEMAFLALSTFGDALGTFCCRLCLHALFPFGTISYLTS
jgi:hypothetical protein